MMKKKENKKNKNGNSKRTANILKRKLLKIGIYSAPIIMSISIPDIKIQAQTPTEEPGSGDIPAPIFRKKKNIIEEDKEKRMSNKRIRVMSIYERSKNILKSPFKKSPLNTKEEEGNE